MNKRPSVFLTLLLTLATGLLSNASFAATQWDSDLYSVYTGDYNGDGLQDIILKGIVIIIPMDGLIIPIIRDSAVLQQNSDGTYSTLYPVSLSSINAITLSSGQYNIIEGDFNGDGITDFLLQAQNADDPSFIMYGEGSSALPSVQNLQDVTNTAVNADAVTIIVSDTNGDGRDDLIITNMNYGHQTILLGSETGIRETNYDEITGGGSTGTGNEDVSIEVGTLAGKLKVLPNGATTYRVPLNVPPGINGMQPQLALAYNSRGGNGEFGVGWALQGVSSISRCPTNLAIDGFIDGVDYDDNDQLCFGGQRLIPINGDEAHIMANTEYRLAQNNAIKILSLGSPVNGPQYFAVYYKNGRIDYFGADQQGVTEDATSFYTKSVPEGLAVRAAPGQELSFAKKSYRWRLKESLDRFGNNVLYHYILNEDTGVQELESITYSAYEISLERESRQDPLAKVDRGMAYQQVLSRVSRITIAVNGATSFASYGLEYQQEASFGFGISKLQSLQYCGADKHCLEPLSFEWTTNSEQEYLKYKNNGEVSSTLKLYEGNVVRVADINGDGRKDLVNFYSKGVFVRLTSTHGEVYSNSSNPSKTTFLDGFVAIKEFGSDQGWSEDSIRELVDVNGDGRSDIVGLSPSGPLVALATEDGFFQLQPISNGDFGADNGWDKTTPVMFADMNADGLADIVGFGQEGVSLAYGRSDGTFTESVFVLEDFGVAQGWTEDHPRKLADINGDGLTDIIGFFDSGPQIAVGTRNGEFLKVSTGLNEYSNQEGGISFSHYRVVDINGDGRDDILGFSSAGVVAFLSIGDGQFIQVLEELPFFGTSQGWADSPIFVKDLNADGYNDLIGFSSDHRMYVAHSKGNGEFMAPVIVGDFPSFTSTTTYCWRDGQWWIYGGGSCFPKETVTTTSTSQQGGIPFVEDLDGDGVLDVIKISQAKTVVRINSNAPHMITGFNNGHRGNVTVNLEPLSSSEAYSQTETATYPEKNYRGPYYVTTQVDRDDGKGSTRSTSYAYSDLKVHQQGIGLLGFREITVTDDQSPLLLSTATEYSQDWQNRTIGMVLSQTRKTESGQILSQVDNILATNKIPYGSQYVYQSYVDTSTQQKWDLNGVEMGSTVVDRGIDTYNNPTSKLTTVTDPGGLTYTTQETNTFRPADESSWFVGLVERQSITNTVPHTLPYQDSTQTKTSAYEYYPLSGALKSSTIEPENETLRTITDFVYDENGLASSATINGNGLATRKSSTIYDGYGRLKSETNAEMNDTYYYYEDNRFPWLSTRSVDANGIEAQVVYDEFGKAKTQLFADDTSVTSNSVYCSTELNDCDPGEVYFVEEIKTASAPIVRYFDQFDREVRVSTESYDSTGDVANTFVNQFTRYDSRGRVYEVSAPEYGDVDTLSMALTETLYDDLDRPKTITYPDGSTKTLTYNGLEVISERSKEGSASQTTSKKSNALGQVIQATDAVGNTIDYVYDAFGSTVKTTDSSDISVEIEYNVAGQKLRLNDPDKGEWFYQYDPLGQLILQTDAKGQKTHFQYDKLGRKTTRTDYYQTDNASSATWVYDQGYKSIGQLSSVSEASYSESYQYDSIGRLKSTTTTIDGMPLTQQNTYDVYGRIDTVTYPGEGLTTRNVYDNTLGILVEIQNASDTNKRYWKLDSTNARGQLKQFTLGNGVITRKTYDDLTGNLTAISADTPVPDKYVQDMSFIYDYMGNLRYRKDFRQAQNGLNLDEEFIYDGLNRLKQVITIAPLIANSDISIEYDAMGNILKKDGVGDYAYTQNYDSAVHGPYQSCANINPGPHAVRSIVGAKPNTFCYDLNGNMIHDNARDIEYSAFDKPTVITQDEKSIEYQYGPSRARYKRIDRENSLVTSTTTYVGNLERVVTGSQIKSRYYIGDFAVVTTTGNTNPDIVVDTPAETSYLYRDHLGSLVAITDSLGNVTEDYSFDAWGQRRLASVIPMTDWTQLSTLSSMHGYGDHEQLDEMNLVHMNGRIYDPLIGRFMSADVIIQAPYFSQSYNRYSYVMNNPMSMVDPSGYAGFNVGFSYGGNGFAFDGFDYNDDDGKVYAADFNLNFNNESFDTSYNTDLGNSGFGTDYGLTDLSLDNMSFDDVMSTDWGVTSNDSYANMAMGFFLPNHSEYYLRGEGGSLFDNAIGVGKGIFNMAMDLVASANPVSGFTSLLGYEPPRFNIRNTELGGAAIVETLAVLLIPAKAGGLAGSVSQISKGGLRHIRKHNFNEVVRQLPHILRNKGMAEVRNKINTGFFPKDWSTGKINNAANRVYNEARWNGVKKDSIYTSKVGGERVSVYINEQGVFGSAYGHRTYSLKDFGL